METISSELIKNTHYNTALRHITDLQLPSQIWDFLETSQWGSSGIQPRRGII